MKSNLKPNPTCKKRSLLEMGALYVHRTRKARNGEGFIVEGRRWNHLRWDLIKDGFTTREKAKAFRDEQEKAIKHLLKR